MNCLVVGGSGFIGAYVVRDLLAKGHKVVVYDSLPEKNVLQMLWTREELEGVKLIHGDVTDLALLASVTKENKIDSLIHLAAWQIPSSHNNPTAAINVNGIGFNNSLKFASWFGLQRVVWTSSNAVFGSPKSHSYEKIPNDEYHKPNTVYGALKSLNEYMAAHYFENKGVNSIGFRFCLVYGFGRMRGASTFASEMIEKAALGEPCVVDNGDAVVDWFYIVDAAHLIVQALEALGLNGGEVHEDVIALLARNEAEALFRVEKLHYALGHDYSILICDGPTISACSPPVIVVGCDVPIPARPHTALAALFHQDSRTLCWRRSSARVSR